MLNVTGQHTSRAQHTMKMCSVFNSSVDCAQLKTASRSINNYLPNPNRTLSHYCCPNPCQWVADFSVCPFHLFSINQCALLPQYVLPKNGSLECDDLIYPSYFSRRPNNCTESLQAPHTLSLFDSSEPFSLPEPKRIFEILEFLRILLLSSFWHFELIANTRTYTSTDGRTADAKNPGKKNKNDEQIKLKCFDSTFSWIPIVNYYIFLSPHRLMSLNLDSGAAQVICFLSFRFYFF